MRDDYYLAVQSFTDDERAKYDKLMEFSKEWLVMDNMHLMTHHKSDIARIRRIWHELDQVNEALQDPDIDHAFVVKELVKAITDHLNWIGVCDD